jgi:hypothetical protein
MRPLANGLQIKPGETVEFAPGSFHIMLVGLKRPLAAGNHVKSTLMFEKAGAVDVEFDVLPMAQRPITPACRECSTATEARRFTPLGDKPCDAILPAMGESYETLAA